MTVKNVGINPNEIKKSVGKAQGPADSGFNSIMGAMDAMTPLATELTYQGTGSTNAVNVLNGAFTGVGGAAGAYGFGTAAMGGGYGGYGALGEYPGMMGVGSAGTYGGYAGGYKAASVTTGGPGDLPGTPGFNTKAAVETMNLQNLKLLELQAVMQSNMQAWNTKANILSADHRARMAMIEKFAARG